MYFAKLRKREREQKGNRIGSKQLNQPWRWWWRGLCVVNWEKESNRIFRIIDQKSFQSNFTPTDKEHLLWNLPLLLRRRRFFTFSICFTIPSQLSNFSRLWSNHPAWNCTGVCRHKGSSLLIPDHTCISSNNQLLHQPNTCKMFKISHR